MKFKTYVWYIISGNNRNSTTMNEHFLGFYWFFLFFFNHRMMGNIMKPHTKLLSTLISMLICADCLTQFTVVHLNLQEDAGLHFCFVSLLKLCCCIFLCCFLTDFVTVAEIIRVLLRNPKPDGEHLLETDILDSIFVQIWPTQLKAISLLNYYQIGKFPFLTFSNDLLSVSNNGLFFIWKKQSIVLLGMWLLGSLLGFQIFL